MPYCENCGAKVGSDARAGRAHRPSARRRFCSNCAHPLRTELEAVSPDSMPAAAAAAAIPSLNDVPWWLGWLGILVPPTFIGSPIYCWWAYRRGRRDGVGREPNESPYTQMGWRTVGWVAFLLVPILGFYTYVHLPTLWYKHGLRVGAKEGSASPRFTSLPAVIGAAVLGAVAALTVLGFLVSGGISSGGDERGYVPPADSVPISQPAPIATRSVPRLTGAEAAGKANNSMLESVRQSDRRDLSAACVPEDHNDITGKWIVLCRVTGPQNSLDFRAEVDDQTGSVKWPTLTTPR